MQQKEHASRDDKGYIHGLKIEKAPQYVLANRRQLQDVVRFATNPIKFSVVGIDPTIRHTTGLSELDFNHCISLGPPLFTRPI